MTSAYALERSVVVDFLTTHFGSGLNPSLLLLHHVPGFVRQMLFLPRPEMYVTPLRIRVGIELCGLRRAIMHA